MHTIFSDTQYTNESKHSEMGPVRQISIQRTVRSVHMCVHCTVHHSCTQYCTKQTWKFSHYPPDNHHCSEDVYAREGGKHVLSITNADYRHKTSSDLPNSK